VLGCAVGAVGFYLWGSKLDTLSFGNQWYYLAIAGAGMGLVLGPVSADALNRAPRSAYGVVTGITQTVRYFGGSLGLAVLGSILITETTSRVETTLGKVGVPTARADRIAHAISGASGAAANRGSRPRASSHIFHAVQLDFALATRTVVYGMAAAMAVAFVAAVVRMPSGRAEQPVSTSTDPQTGRVASG
jgi:hypothetical protein